MDVKVCCTMREAFSLLDFTDPSIVDLKRLLLQVRGRGRGWRRGGGRPVLC